MKIERRPLQATLSVVGVAVIALFVAQGCKRQEPMAQQAQPNQAATVSQSDQAATAAKENSIEAADQVVATAEQKTCPVMEGNPINKAVFVEYEGKKVYFCCKGCPETFLADPEKYIAKLPQFQQ